MQPRKKFSFKSRRAAKKKKQKEKKKAVEGNNENHVINNSEKANSKTDNDNNSKKVEAVISTGNTAAPTEEEQYPEVDRSAFDLSSAINIGCRRSAFGMGLSISLDQMFSRSDLRFRRITSTTTDTGKFSCIAKHQIFFSARRSKLE